MGDWARGKGSNVNQFALFYSQSLASFAVASGARISRAKGHTLRGFLWLVHDRMAHAPG